MKTVNNYSDAVNYFGNSFVLCNNVMNLDSESWFDNLRGDWYDEEGDMPEIYQTFVSDCSEEDVQYLCDWFGLLFYYSEALDCFILCVPHFGTMWRGVSVEDNRPEEYK